MQLINSRISLSVCLLSALLLGSASLLAEEKASSKGRLSVESDDIHLKLSGSLQFDAISYDGAYNNSRQGNTGSDLFFRRARLALSGKLPQNWSFKLEYDFNNSEITDNFLKYTGFGDKLGIQAGGFKPPFGMNNLTSSKDIVAPQRNILNQTLAESEETGVALYGRGDLFTYKVGAFKESRGADNEVNLMWAGRITYTPVPFANGYGIHLGLAYIIRRDERSSHRFVLTSGGTTYTLTEAARINGRPALHIPDSANRIISGDFAYSGEERRAIEFMGVWKSLFVAAEWIEADYDGVRDPAGRDWGAKFDGYSVEAAYILTGQSRPYKAAKGVIGAPKATSPTGAVEIYARYSEIDLRANNSGAKAEVLTVGVNWFYNSNIRLSAYYSSYDNDSFANDSGNALGLRVQFRF